MKIVVLGGTGNISQSIVNALLSTGHDVTCYNRGKSGVQPDGVRFFCGDRRERSAFEQIMRKNHFDAAIDMICYSAEDALSSIRAFREVGHFVQCSTVCTYGVDYDWLPVTEDHPLRPNTGYGRDKVAADAAYMAAYYAEGFPVTIIKPSTTYGPKQGLLRQIAHDYSWIDRIRKSKPILTGNGDTPHQFLHVNDAAKAFAGVIGKADCIGKTYNMCKSGFTTWAAYHRTAMKLLGRQVEMIGISSEVLESVDRDRFSYFIDVFSHNCYYSSERIYRDVPEFQPAVSLEQGMCEVLDAMDRTGMIPDSDTIVWEDKLIDAQRAVAATSLT